MEPYQEAPSQILRAIRGCVTQEGEWTRDLPWMSQPALTASDRGISNRLTGRKVAKASRLWVGHKKNGCHQPIFCVRCDKDVFRTRPVPRQTKGVNTCFGVSTPGVLTPVWACRHLPLSRKKCVDVKTQTLNSAFQGVKASGHS